MIRWASLAALALLSGCATSGGPTRTASADLARLDEEQRRLVAEADAAGLERLAHDDLQINAPSGRVLDRAAFLAGIRGGSIAAERFERTAETIRISGDVGVVMGSEIFVPAPTSELGRTYGAVPLQRRYTNIYLFEGGRWKWLARHANVVGVAATR